MYVTNGVLLVKRDIELLTQSIVTIADAVTEMEVRLKHIEEEAAWNKHDNGDKIKYPLAPDLD